MYETGDLVAIKRTQLGAGVKLRPKNQDLTSKKRNDRYDVEKVDA